MRYLVMRWDKPMIRAREVSVQRKYATVRQIMVGRNDGDYRRLAKLMTGNQKKLLKLRVIPIVRGRRALLLEDVARRLGVSRQRAHQIEDDVLRKIQRAEQRDKIIGGLARGGRLVLVDTADDIFASFKICACASTGENRITPRLRTPETTVRRAGTIELIEVWDRRGRLLARLPCNAPLQTIRAEEEIPG